MIPRNGALNEYELRFGQTNAATITNGVYPFPNLSNPQSGVVTAFKYNFLDDNNVMYPKDGWTVIKRTNNCSYQLLSYYYDNNVQTAILQQTKSISSTPVGVSNCNSNSLKTKFLSGDFNGDGFTDVISIFAYTENKVFLTNLNTNVQSNYNRYFGTFNFFVNNSSLGIINNNTKIDVLDFNGDGQSDFMVFDALGIKVYTLNLTTNQIITLTTVTALQLNSYSHAGTQYDFHFGDFNGDGKSDFAMQAKVNNSDFWVFFLANGISFQTKIGSVGEDYWTGTLDQAKVVAFNNNFLDNSSFWKDYQETKTYKSFIVNDFNQDGKADVLVNRHEISVRRYRRYNDGPIVDENYWFQNRTFNHTFCLRSNVNSGTNGFTFQITECKDTALSCPNANPDQSIINNCDYSDDDVNQYWDMPLIDASGNLTIIKGHRIKSFPFKKNRNNVLLTKVITGNGVNQKIIYSNFKKVNTNDTYLYPYIKTSPFNKSIFVVSKLIKQSKNTTKYQNFEFINPLFHSEGLGFLGFKESIRTDWFDDPNKIFSNINVFDLYLRGALVKSSKLVGVYNPTNYYVQSDFIINQYHTYNTTTEALLINKVFKLKNTKTETMNSLDNTSNESTSVLDVYNNPITVTTNVKNNGVIEKTTISTIAYDNQPTATTFVIGRPTSKVVNTKIYLGQTNEDTAINEEQYAYTNHLLTQIKKKATNSGLTTGFLTEDNIFDAFGNITRKTITAVGETPRITNFEYSTTYSSRFLTKSIDVEGLETVYTYDVNKGLVLTELMPSNEGFPFLTTNTYDTWGKKIKVKNYLNKEINYAYTRDVEKTLITATSDDGSSTTELYDDLGRKIKTGSKTIDGTWAYTETQYDNFDRAIKTSEPYFEGATKLWNETIFDIYGRPLQIKAATGKIANYTYPAFLTTNVNDGTLNKTNVKNAIGNVISMTDTPGGTITYQYFANGNLNKTIYEGQETIITQDGWGRKTKLIEPSAGEYNYTYNGFGQGLTETTPNGATTYTYTTIGKLNTKWVKGKPSPDGNFSGTNILSTYEYYDLPVNRMLKKVTVLNPNDGNSEYNYTYDNNKRIIYTKEEFTTIAPRKFENNLEYDLFGRISSEISTATINGFVSAKTVFNEYKNGELYKKRENNASGNPIWTLNSRNARGQITSATLGNNLIAHTNTYHDLGHTLITNYNKVATPTVNIMTLTNTYDYVQGNMLTRSNSLFSWNETFGYDALDRLTNYTNKNGAQITQEYENNGKIKNNALGTYRYSSAKPYQNTSIKLSPDGLLEPGLMQTQTIVYSAFKAPLSIVQGSQRTFFGYNFAQDRSVMYFGNSNTNKLLQPKRRFYSADGTMEITMTLATATLPASYEFTTFIGGDAYTAPALDRQVNNASSSVFYLHRDHLGTILAITNSIGDVVEKRLFDAWGDIVKVQNGAGAALPRLTFIDRGYTGHEHLQYFRLINMNGRLYDPRLHRFLQPDNNLQEPDNTQNYNRYAYCVNNPLKYSDPSGESFWGWIAGVIIKTFFTTAQATGEGNPLKWSAATWQNAGMGILSSGVSSIASDKLNSYIDNYGKHPVIEAGTRNPVESHTFVNKEYRNEPPVSFFMRSSNDKDLQVFTNVFDQKNKKGNYNNDDSIFDIYGHGAVGYFSDDKLLQNMTNAVEFDNRMSKVSLSYRKLINSGTDPKVINLYLCESAKGGIESMAYLISKQHPNTTVVGFSNYVMYGQDKNGVPRINGISTNQYTNLKDGYRIVYQNGEIISKILYSTFQLFNK